MRIVRYPGIKLGEGVYEGEAWNLVIDSPKADTEVMEALLAVAADGGTVALDRPWFDRPGPEPEEGQADNRETVLQQFDLEIRHDDAEGSLCVTVKVSELSDRRAAWLLFGAAQNTGDMITVKPYGRNGVSLSCPVAVEEIAVEPELVEAAA